MYHTERIYDEPTTETFILTVLERTSCNNHSATEHVPCWAIEGGTPGNYMIGVCNGRAVRAGFNAKISQSSVKRNYKKEYKK